MRAFRFALIATSFIASAAFASPTAPQNGVEYKTLAQPQTVAATGKKVEVIEFFMYHCPHCYAFEPWFDQWVKKQGDKIVLRRIHMPYTGPNDPEAHLFLTLEAMGKSEETLPKIFKSVHVDRVRWMKEDAILDWANKSSIDRKKFQDTWNSFGVMTKLHRAPQVDDNYEVSTTPTIVIDGKYLTSPAMANATINGTTEQQVFTATQQVMDALVAKAAAARN